MRAQNMQEYEAQMAEYIANRDNAMLAGGVVIGDTVECHAASLFGVFIRTGVLYMTKKGQPKVRATDGKTYGWHKGWRKANG